jgi:recombination protein RecR
MTQRSSPEQLLVPEPVARLIEAFTNLPGIGPKSASRLAFFLLRSSDDHARPLAEALIALREQVGFCTRCFNISVGELCPVCANPRRDPSKVCVVEQPLDVVAIERSGVYRGLYHILHGHVAPLEGVYREDLKIDALLDRVRSEPIEEVILATNPNTEGEATAFLIHRDLVPLGVRITRPARGLPTGGDLEWADTETLGSALEGRREL